MTDGSFEWSGDGEIHFPNDPDTKRQTTKCVIWTALVVCLIISMANPPRKKRWICIWSTIQDWRFVESKQILMMAKKNNILDSQM